MSTPVLEMKRISKRFPGVQALSNVDLKVRKKEILALLGENGAGKSTLMKLLAGVYQPDLGEIYIDGQKVFISNPWKAQKLGISVIYQEFNLISCLSVAENIFLGHEPQKMKGIVDWKLLNRQARKLMDRVGLQYKSPEILVEELSVAEQQLVEIAKSLSYTAKVIIMDEPTAALNDEDITRLLKIMVELKEQGLAIIFITHRLEEVKRVAGRVMVLRDGQCTGGAEIENISKSNIIHMMVGRDIKDMFPGRSKKIGKPALWVNNLSIKNKLYNINLTVKEGEILGIGGLMGSGSAVLARALFGIYSNTQGTIMILGDKKIRSIKEAINAGIALVSDDRKSEGLVLSMSVYENILLPAYRRISALGIFIKPQKLNKIVNRWISVLKIKVPNSTVEVKTLSGGNQQRVVLAKWLQMKPKVLILHQPTRGIDVSAKAEIYQLMKKLTEENIAIILISSEMPELLGMSHRIMVMHKGRMAGELPIEEATQEKLLIYATGGKLD